MSTPSGRPASRRTSASGRAILGDRSLGSTTTVLPVTRAATVIPDPGIANGKFQGGMTAATPRTIRSIALVSRARHDVLRAASPSISGHRTREVDRLGDVSSALAPGLAALINLQAARLKRRARMIAAASSRTDARSATEVDDHMPNRSRAIATASWASLSPRPNEPAARSCRRMRSVELNSAPVSTSRPFGTTGKPTELSANRLQSFEHRRAASGRLKSAGGSFWNGGNAGVADSTFNDPALGLMLGSGPHGSNLLGIAQELLDLSVVGEVRP